MQNKRVAILGANGQVGSELALLMSLSKTLKPIAIARSSYSLALLKKLGIKCFVARNTDELKNILSRCDAAVELVHPWHENIKKMKEVIVERCKVINSSLPKDSPIIYCSTKSIYNEDPNIPKFTLYGNTKLFAEEQFRKMGKIYNKKVCILRLGEVHGAMQGCTLSLMSSIKKNRMVRVPNMLSNTVFVSSIEESINKFINGEISEDTYTMIESPEWSFSELTNWMAIEANTETKIKIVPAIKATKFSLKSALTKKIKSFMKYHKELITLVLTSYIPYLYKYLKKQYLCSTVKSKYLEYEERIAPLLFIQYFNIPGKRVPTLSDSRITMPPKYKKIKELLSTLLK